MTRRPGPPAALPFVQLEFTHAVGVPPGIYLVAAAPASPSPSPGALGSGDSLLSEVVQARPSVRAPLVARRGRRTPMPAPTPAEAGAPAAPVPLAVLTHVLATEAFADLVTAEATLARWAADPGECELLVERALTVVNLGIAAYRTAAGDPYAGEVMSLDPRAVRIGFGVPGEIGAGRWLGAWTLPRDEAPPDDGPSVDELRVTERVAAALGGQIVVYEAEELALRALLDLNHGRARAAAAGAAAAVAVLAEELAAQGVDTAGAASAPPPAGCEAIEAAALHVLETAAAFHAARLRDPGAGRAAAVALPGG